jgi:membrane protein
MRAELAALELHRLNRRRVQQGVAALAEDFSKYDLLTYSSAIAFQLLYAVIPLVLLGLAGLGLFGLRSVYLHHVAPTLHHDLSHDAFQIVDRTARKVMNGKRLWWTTVGLAVTLWGVGAALRATMRPLNGVYGARETRSYLNRLATSIAGGLLVVVCVYAAILLVLAGRLVHVGGPFAVPFFLLRWFGTLALLLLTIGVVLRFVPAKKRPVEWVSVGSVACCVCWIVATLGFAGYITAVSYSSFYGASATLVVLLVYLHVAAIAFLLGVVVDARLRELVSNR